ncbi:RING-H2 finger protein ATL74-like [Miscanthus floridulus]|uniref:RING-H2 finger protein ATL74-like n=1 Tax=Miscanthus floridulus TaxID=154761 RepID=UPI00345AC75A
MRHLQGTVVEHLAGVAAAATATPPPSSVHTETFVILAAVLCFLLCVVGLAFVARCSRLCNPSSNSVDAAADEAAAAMPAAAGAPRPRKGVDKDALEKLPTVPFEAAQDGNDERPECAICLAEFARGDEVRVLPPCGHAFHAACVDTWLICTSTCPSCRTALVVVQQQAPAPAAASADPLQCCASAQASAGPAEFPVTLAVVVVERGPCRTSVP